MEPGAAMLLPQEICRMIDRINLSKALNKISRKCKPVTSKIFFSIQGRKNGKNNSMEIEANFIIKANL